VPSGLAQTVNVTDGFNSFSWVADQTGGDSQTLAGTSNILFEEGWFLIVGGQSTRLENTPAGNISISGNNTPSATVSYSGITTATGAVFDVDLNYQVGSSPSGVIDLDIDLELTLQSAPPVIGSPSPVVGSLINYFDYDINGASDQTGTFTNTPVPTITQLDPESGDTFSRTGVGANAYDIDSFSTLIDNLDAGVLLDSTPDLGLIDVTSAFQWDFTFFPGETSFSVSAGGFGAVGVPEPSTLAMFSFLGLVASLKRSRIRG
jgi:hypothetical protein